MNEIEKRYPAEQFVLNKVVSYARRLRVRATKHVDGSLSFVIYHHTSDDRVVWEYPITVREASLLDWSFNVFGYQKLDGGWAYNSNERDYSEQQFELDWLSQFSLPE